MEARQIDIEEEILEGLRQTLEEIVQKLEPKYNGELSVKRYEPEKNDPEDCPVLYIEEESEEKFLGLFTMPFSRTIQKNILSVNERIYMGTILGGYLFAQIWDRKGERIIRDKLEKFSKDYGVIIPF